MTADRTPQLRQRAAQARLRGASKLLDSRWRVPGTRLRFGLDAIIGLIPVAGDVFGGLLSLWLLGEAWRLRVPKRLFVRMLGNALLDVGLGVVPVLGDVFDLLWRNNKRNMDLLDQHLDQHLHPPPPARRSKRGWLLAGLALLIIIWFLFMETPWPNFLAS